MPSLSVIIPIAPGDDTWQGLVPCLSPLASDDEIIFVVANGSLPNFKDACDAAQLTCAVRVERAPLDRAQQLNAGAKAANNEFLWFLHADSRLPASSIAKIRNCLRNDPSPIYFFDLNFHDGPLLMQINTFGVRLRANILRLPFGDQGFCLQCKTFSRLDGFDEQAPYGEDHLLVWRAHQSNVPVRSVGEAIYTSARKYQKHGWLNTTASHLKLTALQAFPELVTLLKGKFS